MTTELEHPLGSKNFVRVEVGPLILWWSYNQCVAFQSPEATKPYVLNNESLSKTSQRHVDSLGDSWKLSDEVFKTALTNTVQRLTKTAH